MREHMSSIITKRFIKCHNQLKENKIVRSSRQFALSLDYLPQSLSEILKGRRDVTIELLRKAIELYKINPFYIYTGEGPMFMKDNEHKDFRVLTIVTNMQEDERIVHVPIPAQAGYATEMSNPSFIQELPHYNLPDYKYHVGTHRSFDVSGDSMEPTLFEGDKVICSFVEPTLWETAIKDNYVYIIVTKGDVVVKRVFSNIEEKQTLSLHSDNKSYAPYEVNMGDIREIWYVRAKISPFLPSPTNLNRYMREEISDLKATILQQSKLIEKLTQTLDNVLDQRVEKT